MREEERKYYESWIQAIRGATEDLKEYNDRPTEEEIIKMTKYYEEE